MFVSASRSVVSRVRRRVPCVIAGVAVATGIGALSASPALAAFGIKSFSGSVTQAPPAGSPSVTLGPPATQAGSHPYAATTTIGFNSVQPTFFVLPDGSVKDIRVSLPAGFIGNPQATPRCTDAQLRDISSGAPNACPVSSQVGIVEIDAGIGFTGEGLPVYNMVPPPGTPAEFAFNVGGNIVHLIATVRSGGADGTAAGGDYGLDVVVPNVNQAIGIVGTSLTFWGVPADPSHDSQRCPYGVEAGVCPGYDSYSMPHASDAPPIPFLTNPTNCDAGPLTTTLSVDSWESPGTFFTSSFDHDVNDVPMAVDGCDRLPFTPNITVQPTNHLAGAPTGLDVVITVPQTGLMNPTGLAQPSLKKTVVTLPAGMSVSPAAAAGLGGCSSTEIALNSAAPAGCKDDAKVGTVEIDTPLLDHPLTGGIYLASPGDNPFHSLLAVYLAVSDPQTGLVIKLPGQITPNGQTGQLTATFDDNPQLPFSALKLRFFAGPRAALSNPATCGTQTTDAQLSSYGGQIASQSDSFTIDTNENGSPCAPQGFAPAFTAGTITPVAGQDSPFTMTFSRGDGDQTLGGLALNLPAGLLGRIANVQQCSEAAIAVAAAPGYSGRQEQASPSCPAGSLVGTTTVGAGPGTSPFHLGGQVYFAGPYKGAPLSLVIVVPALAGPFDLGTVVVRAAIFVDPSTAALRVVSDPLPTILQGIPLQLRTVTVTLDRKGFMFNPSSCTPSRVAATISSTQGAVSNVSSRFQVGDCAALRYTPKLSITVGRKGRTTRRKHLPFTAVLTQPAGQANNRTVETTLPATINSRIASLTVQCTMAAFVADRCPSGSRVGTASAITPVLGAPLRGSAYFVKNPKGGLPTMMVALKGQVRLNIRGDISIPQSKFLRVRITSPDAPVTRFRLTLTDGPNAPLSVAVASLCTARNRAQPVKLGFRAQNGALVKTSQRMHVLGCTTKRAAKGG